jgi:ribosome biogenesis GTPase
LFPKGFTVSFASPSPSFSSSVLAALGWDAFFAGAFAEHAAAGLVPARVVRVDRGRCDTLTADGPVRAAAPPAPGGLPEHGVCTGDWAALRPGAAPALEALLPRRTAIVRASAGRTSRRQVLAANVDTVVVAVSLASPPDPARTERLLALAWDSGARPVLALTKADTAGDADAWYAEATALAPGADVVVTSAATGEGIDALAAAVTGTTVLLGPSGAGKSSLANALLGREELATGTVREVDGKGRHTTVRRELVPLPGGGVLIDTPGLRGVGLQDTGAGIEQAFADVEAFAAECAFRDCAHTGEPGCAVLRAVESGELTRRRLDSYRKLLRESAFEAARGRAWRDPKRSAERKSITRYQRAHYRERGDRR